MDKLFGDYLVKHRKEGTPEESKAPSKPQTQGEDAEHPSIIERPSCYTRIPIEESLLISECQYIALLFTAEYAPPCAPFLQAFTAFSNEANKNPASRRFEVVVVNCDKNEEEY
jgi:thiol-disulfide isomerase/thioredoxin